MGFRKPLLSVVVTLFTILLLTPLLQAVELTAEKQEPLYERFRQLMPANTATAPYSRKDPDLWATPPLLQSGVGFDFNDNATQTGFFNIPPDPHVAAGDEWVINLGNVLIEWRLKAAPATAMVQQSLQTFFSALPGPSTPVLPNEKLGTTTFDPKVIYDQHEDRFIVITLEVWDNNPPIFNDPSDESRILVAVSKTNDPNLGWWLHAIDTKLIVNSVPAFADYPGIAVDDKAIYLTANMFGFSGTTTGINASRLWIIDKNPFYNGPDQSAVVNVYDPYTATGGIALTTQPAHMYGTPPPNMGTFLVSYNGLTDGVNEYVQVISVMDPLGASGGPAFAQSFLNTGDIENSQVVLPDAPQLGGQRTIEVNDRRALNAVWRNNMLYMSATILPTAGPDAGQTTAHFWQLNMTAGVGGMFLVQQVNIGAEDLGDGTYTFFPSVMVDKFGSVAVGFAASSPTIYCGAYYASRHVLDVPGTIQNTQTLMAGIDYYVRTFDNLNPNARNRWGDYSGLSLCPTDEYTMWVYNEYACAQGSPTGSPPESGRWCTHLGSIAPLATGITPDAEPRDLALGQNYPNPFNPTTSIRYSLTTAEHVKLQVFDLRGRLVATLVDGVRNAGDNYASWNGKNAAGNDVATGVYYYKMATPSFEKTRKMVLLK